MQYLLEQQHKLKRSKFINDFIITVHTYIASLGIIIALFFYDVNITATLFGLVITIYALSLGMFVVAPFCLDRQVVFDEKLLEIKDNIKQVEQIHLSLDLLRNAMLFDEDETYWQTIEKLPVVFDELD